MIVLRNIFTLSGGNVLRSACIRATNKIDGYKLDHSVSWALLTQLLEVSRPKLLMAKNTSIKKVT